MAFSVCSAASVVKTPPLPHLHSVISVRELNTRIVTSAARKRTDVQSVATQVAWKMAGSMTSAIGVKAVVLHHARPLETDTPSRLG